jgi:ubiquitin carboxyl-terminal hydrolase 14
MGSTTIAYTPMGFVNTLRQLFVQFDERGGDGLHKQQDAEEAWSQIFSVLRSSLNDPTFVDKYFGGRFETTLKCDEAENEPPKVETVDFLKLECHISISTNFLRDGLLDGLKEKIEKHSETLNRDAQYTLSKKITRLPKYLTVHYVRFFWRRDTNKKSKILRKVSFPFNFDATELCSDELQKKIIPAREKHREVEKEKQEMESTLKKQKNNNGTSSIPSSKQAEFESQIAQAVDEDLKNDVGCNPTGLYQLSAVITHQGPNADGGHYQCFSRNDQEEGKWFRFNDDKVTIVDQTKIEQLAGGGEFDSALILLYKAASI